VPDFWLTEANLKAVWDKHIDVSEYEEFNLSASHFSAQDGKLQVHLSGGGNDRHRSQAGIILVGDDFDFSANDETAWLYRRRFVNIPINVTVAHK
jgi:hypothetical protein